jgi:hypothetical protein
MDWIVCVVIAGWVSFSGYLIWTGVRMVVNAEYPNYIATLWLRSATDKEEKRHQQLVKIIDGPGYILYGLFLLAIGIGLLDIKYGILSKIINGTNMDIRAWELIIAIGLIFIGSVMVFNDKHYSTTEPGAKVSKHLAKVQGSIALAGGILFLLHWLFW